jgi:hypothetical protein
VKPADRELVHQVVDDTRAAQGFPPTVSSPAAIAVVVAQLRATQPTQQEVAMTMTRRGGE